MGQSQPKPQPMKKPEMWDLCRLGGYPVGSMTSMIIDDKTQNLLVGSDNGTIVIFDLALRNKPKHVYLDDIHSITALAFLNSKILLVATSHGNLKSISRDSFIVLESVDLFSDSIISIRVSSYSSLLALGTTRGKIVVITAAEKKKKLEFNNISLPGSLEFTFTPDASYVISFCESNHLDIIDVKYTNFSCMDCKTRIKGVTFTDSNSKVIVVGETLILLVDIVRQAILKKASFRVNVLTTTLQYPSNRFVSVSGSKISTWKINSDLSFERKDISIQSSHFFTPDKILWDPTWKYLVLLKHAPSRDATSISDPWIISELQAIDIEKREAVIFIPTQPRGDDFHSFVLSEDGKLLFLFYLNVKKTEMKLIVVDMATSSTIKQYSLTSVIFTQARIKFLGEAKRSGKSAFTLKALGIHASLDPEGSWTIFQLYDVVIGEELSFKARSRLYDLEEYVSFHFTDNLFLIHNIHGRGCKLNEVRSPYSLPSVGINEYDDGAVSLNSPHFFAFPGGPQRSFIQIRDLRTMKVIKKIPIASIMKHLDTKVRNEIHRKRLVIVGHVKDDPCTFFFIDVASGKVMNALESWLPKNMGMRDMYLRALSPNCEKMAFIHGWDKRRICVVDIITNKQNCDLSFEHNIEDATFSADSRVLVLVKENGSVKFISLC